jgi:hypothetical protein
MRRVVDLQLLARGLVERLVVGHFLDQLPNGSSKLLFQFLRCGLRVLDGVVKDCGHQRHHIGHATDVREQMRDRNRMVDVW